MELPRCGAPAVRRAAKRAKKGPASTSARLVPSFSASPFTNSPGVPSATAAGPAPIMRPNAPKAKAIMLCRAACSGLQMDPHPFCLLETAHPLRPPALSAGPPTARFTLRQRLLITPKKTLTDQLRCLVLGNVQGKGRCHVENVFAAGDGFWPPSIVFEIGGDEGQAIARHGAAFLQHGAHLALALQVPHRGAYLMADGQELQDGMAADEARPAGHQDGAQLLLLDCSMVSI